MSNTEIAFQAARLKTLIESDYDEAMRKIIKSRDALRLLMIDKWVEVRAERKAYNEEFYRYMLGKVTKVQVDRRAIIISFWRWDTGKSEFSRYEYRANLNFVRCISETMPA